MLRVRDRLDRAFEDKRTGARRQPAEVRSAGESGFRLPSASPQSAVRVRSARQSIECRPNSHRANLAVTVSGLLRFKARVASPSSPVLALRNRHCIGRLALIAVASSAGEDTVTRRLYQPFQSSTHRSRRTTSRVAQLSAHRPSTVAVHFRHTPDLRSRRSFLHTPALLSRHRSRLLPRPLVMPPASRLLPAIRPEPACSARLPVRCSRISPTSS